MTTSADPSAATDPLFGVAGKTVLVTGGTRGIGAMIAEGFVRRGARVLITSRSADVCRREADRLGALGDCSALSADLATDGGIVSVVEAVERTLGGLDVLVNNAGATWGAPIDEYPLEGFDKVIRLNLRSVFALTQALLPLLEQSATAANPSRVITIGSIDGIVTSPGEAYAYGASKAAIHHLSRNLARQLASRHVTSNVIAPGPFYSKMMAFLLDNPEQRAGVEEGVPLGRIGTDDDMAGAASYLASRAGAYLTGTTLVVDGGSSSCR
ncbi:SDR family oxidoreductase [Streptomyces massasporeus]|uniref:SDR family oxidoreductase n=1 Tax=Streptomyces massasporeus TaxID=67324 RepID=UPI0034534A4B